MATAKAVKPAEAAPNPLRRVKVLPPFQVAHEGNVYWSPAVAEVPEALADQWILNGWAADDGA